MASISQDRLIRKEVSLGVIRETPRPENHVIISQIAPFQPVESDDVIFDYIIPNTDGLVAARAEDAESELVQKDDTVGTGRASVIDWAQKDHYDPSDVSRYQDSQYLEASMPRTELPLSFANVSGSFEARVARDARRRRRRIDNRLEWLGWQALENGVINYNDGNISFSVDFQRPAGQQDQAPTGALWDAGTAHDPINDLEVVNDYMWDTYRVKVRDAWTSDKVLRSIINSDKFQSLGNFTGNDPRYTGLTRAGAVAIIEQMTGIRFNLYEAVYRTRAIGSNTVVNNPFLSENKIVFLPGQEYISEIDDTLGFAKTLTSPHPEGNWTSGYYEWEKDTGPDPWGHDMGTGIKAFPVFPHLEYTYVMEVLS